MKINESTMRKSIRRFLFETSYNKYSTDDKVAGKLGDGREGGTIPDSLPIMPASQMATQLSGEEPPVEDENFMPTSNSELSRAAAVISKSVPDDAMEFYYNELVRLADKARNRENKTVSLVDSDEFEKLDAPLNAKKSKKKVKKIKKEYAKKRGKSYINSVIKRNKGVNMLENNKDRKFDAFDEEESEEEYIPSHQDMIDFMYEFPDAAPSEAPGYAEYKSKYSVGYSPEYKLDDIAKTNVKPGVRGASGMKGWIERTIFPILQANYVAPQVTDRLASLMKSQFAQDAFFEAMHAADLLSPNEISDLKMDIPELLKSSMYRFVMTYIIVRPAVTMLRKLQDVGGIDLMDAHSQIAPHEADAIIQKVQDRWNGMNASRKANDAKNGMTAYLEFLERDASVMG